MKFLSHLGWAGFFLPYVLASSAIAQSPPQKAAFETLAQAPDDSGRQSSLLDAWLDEEGFDKLRAHLKSQAVESPLTAAEWKATAGIWERLGDIEEMLKAYAKATELAPADPSLWLQRARVEARRRDFAAAMISLGNIPPEAEEGTLLAALKLHHAISQQQGDRDKFQTWVTRVAEASKSNPRLQLEITRLKLQSGNAKGLEKGVAQQVAEAPDSALRQEWRLLGLLLASRQGQWAEVPKLVQAGMEEAAPGSAQERDFLAYLRASLEPRNWAPGTSITPQALAETCAGRPNVVLSLARQLKETGRLEEAIKLMEKQAATTPDDVMLVRERAETLVEAGREGEAIAILQRHLTIHPEAYSIRVLLSLILHENGRNAEAARLLESWAAQPDAPASRVTQVLSLLPLMRRPQEIEEWKAGLPAQPQEAAATAPDSPPAAASAPPVSMPMPIRGYKPLDAKAPLKEPLAVWRKSPQDLEAATDLVQAFEKTRRPAEQAFLFMRMHEILPDRESRMKWWRQGASAVRGNNASTVLLVQVLSDVLERQNSAELWLALAEVARTAYQGSMDMKVLDRAMQLEPENEDLRHQWLQRMVDTRLGALVLLNARSTDADLLLMAQVHLQIGHPDSARRILLGLMHAPELDARKANALGSGLMRWREWKAAALFIEAQRRRFPRDPGLAALQVIISRETGSINEAISRCLELGSFEEEVPVNGARPQESSLQAQWQKLSMTASSAFAYRAILSRGIEGQEEGIGSGRYWAMAHLVEMAQSMSPAERTALMERARTAGLPVPEAIVLGRLEVQHGVPRLVFDPAALQTRLNEVEMAKLFLLTYSPGKVLSPEASQEVSELMRLCHATLLESEPALSLAAALQAWTFMPDAPVALAAVFKSLESYPVVGDDPFQKILRTFYQLPLKAIREPKTAEDLGKALNALYERYQKLDSKPGTSFAASLARCHLWLGRWTDAADKLEASAPDGGPVDPLENSSIEPSAVLYVGQQSPFSWPPLSLVPEALRPFITRTSYDAGPTVPTTELQAFKSAGVRLKSPLLKVAWLLAAQDEAAATAVIREWLVAEPESESAVYLAVSLALHENDRIRALDQLYNWLVTRPADTTAQRTALIRYLQTALIPVQSRRAPQSEHHQVLPVPASHRDRLVAAAQSLYPTVQKAIDEGGSSITWVRVYEALGLKKEMAKLEAKPAQNTARSQENYFAPGWNPELENMLQDDVQGRWKTQLGGAYPSYNEEAMLKAGLRKPVIQKLLLSLKAKAIRYYFASRASAQDHPQWISFITQHNLAGELMQAAEPGKRRTALRLLHAAEVANACGQWEAMQGFLREARVLLPQEPSVRNAFYITVLRTDSPAVLVKELKGLSDPEVSGLVMDLLQAAGSADASFRMDVAEVLLVMARSRSELVELGREASGTGYISWLFRLLTEAHHSQTGSLPAYYPELARDGPDNDSPSKASPELLQRRKALHDQLCELALQHPEWGAGAAVHLVNRHLVESQPTEEELLKYLQAGVMATPSAGPQFIYNLTSQHSNLTHLGARQKLADLVLKTLPMLGTSPHINGSRADSLLELIGGAVSAPNQPKLYALWEWPGDITQGANSRYTPPQVAWNKERQALMKQFCTWALDRPELRAGVFPRWAGFQMHFDEDLDDVLAQARLLKDHEPDPYGLREFIRMAGTSLSNKHYIKAAELVLAVLQEPGAKLDLVALKPSLAEVMGRLVNGRDNPAGRLPPLSLSPEDAAAHEVRLSASWQKRRQTAYQQMEELLASQDILPADTLFVRLEKALLSGEDAAAAEEKLIQLAAKEPEVVDGKLTEFIKKSFGTNTQKRNSRGKTVYVGGVWDMDKRVLWFESAWRIGRAVTEAQGARVSEQPKWLETWLGQAMQPNEHVSPIVPPVAGTEGGFAMEAGSARRAYEKYPALKRRDDLYLEALEWCLEQRWDWENSFFSYAEVMMDQQPFQVDKIVTAAVARLPENPSEVAQGLDSWAGWEADYDSLPRRMAAGKIALQILSKWPKDDRNSSPEWLRDIKRTIMETGDGRSIPPVSLLPDQWWSHRQQPDPLLQKTPLNAARRNQWVQIINLAAEVPAFRQEVFHAFARLHLEQSPEKVVAVARGMLAANADALSPPLRIIYEEEENLAPMSRRLAWGNLVLELLDRDGQQEDSASGSGNTARWLGSTLTYLQKSPPDYGGPNPPPLTEEELKQRDALVARLMARSLEDPALALEGLVTFARQQFRTQDGAEAVRTRLKQAQAHNPQELANQLNAWGHELMVEKASVEEKIWALQLLATTAEAWPVGDDRSPAHWIPHSMRLFWQGEGVGHLEAGMAPLFDRLLEAGMKHPAQVAPTLVAAELYLGADPERQKRLVTRILSLAGADVAKAAALMKDWWSRAGTGNYYVPTSATRARTARTALLILQDWPQKAPAETLLWTQDLLRYLGSPESGASYFISEDRSPANGVPAAPVSPEALAISKSIVAELQRRQTSGGWLVPVQMRQAGNAAVTADERILSLQPLFAEASARQAALAYLSQVLSDPIKPDENQQHHPGMFFHGQVPPPDAQVEELLDAVRCLLTVIQKSWVPAESLAPLEAKAKVRLDEVMLQSAPPDPQSRGQRFSRILATQREQAEQLQKSWTAVPPTTLGTPMTGAKVPVRIQEGLKAGEPVPQLADLVWSVVQADPAAAQAGLDKWAGDLRPPYPLAQYIQLGELALNLALRWTPEQPAPDWLLTFVTTWKEAGVPSAEDGVVKAEDLKASQSAQSQVLPELFATLRRFPACQGEGYFPAVSAQALESKAATEDELAVLALEHLKAMADRKGTLGSVKLVPELSAKPDRAKGISPLNEPLLGGIGAPLYLLEHAWRGEKQNQLYQECMPVLKQVLEPELMRAFELLARLYFCESVDFIQAGQNFSAAWIRDKETRSSPVWILRVAHLRELPLQVADWAEMIHLPQMTVYPLFNQGSAYSLISSWLYHTKGRGGVDLGADLKVLLESARGRRPADGAWDALLEPNYLAWRDGRNELNHSLAFRDQGWSWSWRMLQSLIRDLDLFPAVVQAAYETGLLDHPGSMAPLLYSAREAGAEASPDVWQGWIKSTGVAGPDAMPEPHWLYSWEGLAPVWEFSKFALAPRADEVLPWLEADQKQQPSIGRALLILGTSRHGSSDISIGAIEKAMEPCRELLQKQSLERRAELSAALLVVQPLLMELSSAAAPSSVLKLLPPPARAGASVRVENRWLEATPETVAIGGSERIRFLPLAQDVCRLLLSGSPRVEEVLEAGVRVLSECDWGGLIPAGQPRQTWIREQVGMSLLAHATSRASGHSAQAFDGYKLESFPEDDGRRQVMAAVLRLLLRREGDFQAVVVKRKFSEMLAAHLSQQFQETGWDAETFTANLLAGLPPASPDAQWLLIPALQKGMVRPPFTSLEKTGRGNGPACASQAGAASAGLGMPCGPRE